MDVPDEDVARATTRQATDLVIAGIGSLDEAIDSTADRTGDRR